jgi:hypothetical protein
MNHISLRTFRRASLLGSTIATAPTSALLVPKSSLILRQV